MFSNFVLFFDFLTAVSTFVLINIAIALIDRYNKEGKNTSTNNYVYFFSLGF